MILYNEYKHKLFTRNKNMESENIFRPIDAEKISEVKGDKFTYRNGSDDKFTDKSEGENKTPTNKWSYDVVMTFRNCAFKSLGSSWIYAQDADYYNNRNVNLNLLTASLSAISSVGIVGAMAMVTNSNTTIYTYNVILYYLISIISLLLNIIIAIAKAYQLSMHLDNKIVDCLQKSSKFGSLHREIVNQFSLLPQDRDNAITFMKYVTGRFDELEREKPFIREETVTRWTTHLNEMKDNNDDDTIIKMPTEFLQSNSTAINNNARIGGFTEQTTSPFGSDKKHDNNKLFLYI